MNHDQIVKHSITCYEQWKEVWRENAKRHSKYKMKSFENLRHSGIGKACLLVANGYSFEENIDTIKQYADNVDITACDKTLGHLIRNGIKPKYCIVCDANVSYEKYLKPYENDLDKTILIQNVCGNPLWTENGNWKDRYFYVNKDVMSYEKEFMKISGCMNQVTAGTNVSNMMVVLMNQSDNDKLDNLLGYDKLLLIGFDYSWRLNGKYYAFDEEADGKQYYMRHIYGVSNGGELLFSSSNLSSSASWLSTYISAFSINAIQCAEHSLLAGRSKGSLEHQMKYSYKLADQGRIRNLLNKQRGLEDEINFVKNSLKDIAKDHWLKSLSS